MVKPATALERINCGTHSPNPHPDGKPWTKCCSAEWDDENSCQCLMKKPTKAQSRFTSIMSAQAFWALATGNLTKLVEAKERFFCVHRKDGEYHRECAGWAAKITKNGRE